MIRQFVVALALLPLSLVGAAEQAKPVLPLPHEGSSLPSDDSVTWGRLDNGLGYAIMPNGEPKDKISLRLYVHAGALQEQQAERGIAHYIEHMAFNGSKNFPPGTVIEQLQKVGIDFGRQFNAHTGFEEVVYKIDLPDTQPETLDLCLRILVDMSGHLTMPEKEVDKERGVIQAEMRDRDKPGLRMAKALYAKLYPGTIIADRFPIGVKETIDAFDSEGMLAYWRRWYQPDHLFLAISGTLDPKAIQASIAKHFGPLPARQEAPEHPKRGKLQPKAGSVLAYVDPELSGTSLRYYRVIEEKMPNDDEAYRTTDMLRDLGTAVISRRLSDMAENENSPILGGGSYIYYGFDFRHVLVVVTPKPGKMQEAVAVIEQETRRFLEHGPTQAELDIAVKSMRGRLEEAISRKATRSNPGLASQLYGSVRDGRVFMTPEQALAVTGPILAAATPATVQKAVVDAWQASHDLLAISSKESLSDDAEAQMQAAWQASTQQKVAAPVEAQVAEWAYGDLPKVELASLKPQRNEKAHGIVHVQYANNSHVSIMPRAAKPNEVQISLRIQMDPGSFRPGLREFASATLLGSGLGKHDAKEMRRILAGAKLRVSGPRFEADGLSFLANCIPEELPRTLQWLRAVLTDIAWRPEVFARAKVSWLRGLEAAQSDLDARVNRHWSLLTTAGTPALSLVSLQEAKALQMEDVQNWLSAVLREGPLEVAIVGDIKADETEALCHQVFGSLAARQPLRVVADLSADGALYPAPSLVVADHSFSFTGSVDRSVIRMAWPTDDNADIAFRRRMGLVGQVLSEQMRTVVREQLGEAYSPYAGHSGSMIFDGQGWLLVHVGVAPGREDTVIKAIDAVVGDLLKNGISEELLAKVKTPAVKNMAAYRDTNGYWLGSVLTRSVSRPQTLAWADNMEQDYQSITAAELTALAKRYLSGERMLLIGTSRLAQTTGENKAEETEEAIP